MKSKKKKIKKKKKKKMNLNIRVVAGDEIKILQNDPNKKIGQGIYKYDNKYYDTYYGTLYNSNDDTNTIYIKADNPTKHLIEPQIGEIVMARVYKLTHKYAMVDILTIGYDKNIKISYESNYKISGIIRKQDVRQFEIDDVKINKSFQPGDIILAEIISLGDNRGYYLS